MASDGTQQAPSADTRAGAASGVTISVDAMGGDAGPSAVISGMELSARKNPEIVFILHGDKAELEPLIARHDDLRDRCRVVHAPRAVSMEDKPAQVVRNGQDTSMWSALESVRDGEATVAVSCGNTGALMALSMLRLRKLPGVNRPAIACLWPSRNAHGFNLMLDVGADVRADAEDLLQYALMGASYARNGFDIDCPRVGLMNVGTEEHKGRAELKAAYELIGQSTELGGFEFVGFVEGGDIPSDRVDVIVTDGFTGNVAIKTGEGTAMLIRDLLRDSFNATLLSRVAGLMALPALKRLQKRIDPRRFNGGVFLGLNGTVVKSHGAADTTGVSAAIKLAFQLAESGFQERLAERVASAGSAQQHDVAKQQDGDSE